MFKDRLRSARKSANLTQKEVAARLGITESTYCGYETGKREPDVMKIKAIASILGVSGDYLLETGFSPVAASTSELSPEALDIARAFEKADEKSRELVELALREYLPAKKQDTASAG